MILSVIIPVYNEERTIGSIIEIVRAWGKAGEIVVVNDGSTDKTLHALAQFRSSVRVITYTTNRGKGYALSKGISASSGEILMFLDGDVVGLTFKDLDIMLEPVLAKKADMTLGLARFWSMGSFEPFNEITGERVVLRKNVLPYIRSMIRLGYGIEFFLNDLHKDKKVISVKLPHVFILGKFEKQKVPAAMLSYIKEARDLVTQALRQQTGELTPQAKRIYTLSLEYMRKALDYFQQPL